MTYDANGGKGTMDGTTLDKGSEYTVLPNAFTAPDDTQEFKAWEVDGQEVAPGAKITVKDNTVVKAVWKKIQVNITYDANGGSGTMTGATVDKGSKYTVLPNGFTAPNNQEFKTWEIDGKEVAAGTEITVTKDTVAIAIWKAKKSHNTDGKGSTITLTYDPNGGNWGGNTSVRKQVETKGVTVKILEAPTKDGYTFQYWKGSEYHPGDLYTANEDHTFIAQWEPNPSVTPSDNPNTPGTPGMVTPNEPNKPAKPGTRAPKTGDMSALSLCASGILAAGGAIALLKKRREER